MSGAVKIKICGLSREADIEAVNMYRPDYIGFVFHKKSRRFIELERAAALKRALDPRIKAAGIFAGEPLSEIIGAAEASSLDVVQLHGSGSAGDIADIKRRTGLPVIRAYIIKDKSDLEEAASSTADMILLDGGMGDGRRFDASLMSGFSRPYFLAGGLTPDNAADAVRALRPWGVDVSSGVEINGVKDADKIRLFIENVRGAEQ